MTKNILNLSYIYNNNNIGTFTALAFQGYQAIFLRQVGIIPFYNDKKKGQKFNQFFKSAQYMMTALYKHNMRHLNLNFNYKTVIPEPYITTV